MIFFSFGGRLKPLSRGRQGLQLHWHGTRLFHMFMLLPPWSSASFSLTGLSHGICWSTSFSAAYVQRAFHQPGSPLPTYKELSTSPHASFATAKPLLFFSATNNSFVALPCQSNCPQPKMVWYGPKVPPWPYCLSGGTGEAKVQHDKTCLQSCQR